MSAYERGSLSPAAYLERVLSGLVRQAGGELRVKGELVDMAGEATRLVFTWDRTKQEVIIRGANAEETIIDVFKVNPEQPKPASTPSKVVEPLQNLFRDAPKPPNGAAEEFLPKGSTLDDTRLVGLERQKALARAAALIKDEMRRRKENRDGRDEFATGAA
jgi:hypothetical protein